MNTIVLKAMKPDAFAIFKERAIQRYAHERLITAEWAADVADHCARVAFDKLLPDGMATPGHRLWCIFDAKTHKEVGSIWIQLRQRKGKRSAHLLDLYVEPPYRRKGYARQAMYIVENRLKTEGVEEITLHVFERNVAARTLYQTLGFHADEDGMIKAIG